MNDYEPVLAETDGGPMCRDCLTWCWRGNPTAPCDVDGCVCPDCERARRAAELDDRDDAALHNIARDMETERMPTLDELQRERHGDHQQLLAERISSAQEPTIAHPQAVNAVTSEDLRIIAKNSSPCTGKPTTVHSVVHSILPTLSTGQAWRR